MRHAILAAVMLAVLAAPTVAAADFDAIRNSLREKMPDVEIGEIRPSPYAGLLEVVANKKNIFYVDDKGEFVFMGNLFDLGKKLNLTQQRIGELNKVDFALLPLDKAIVKVKGNGARKVALFSDPDCPFCKQLEQEMVNVTDVTIYTFLFPLTSIHPDAGRKAELIWCAPDRAKTWDDWMLAGKTLPENVPKCETPMAVIETLGKNLGIEGTPGIVFGSGRLVVGAIPAQQIEALLNAH